MALINALRVLSALSWLAVLAIVGMMVVRAARQQKARGLASGLIVVIVLAVALNVLSAGLVFIEPTERGVVITIAGGGVRHEPLQPGLNWIIPFAESVRH